MASTFINQLVPLTKRIDLFSPLQTHVNITFSCAAILVITITFIVYDYRGWVKRGTGGTPPTLSGWLRMEKLRLLTTLNYLRGKDLRDASDLPRTGPHYLKALTERRGGHPSLRPSTLPQRQIPEPIQPRAQEVLYSLLKHLHSKYPKILSLSLSNAAGGTADAIYARPESPACNAEAQKVGFEIAHVHTVDNSLHLLLSPADARTVVEASWGRRFVDQSSVPPGWIMVYAPRDLEEVKLVQRIVEAAVRWTTGTNI